MELSKRHMRFLWIDQCAVPIIINFLGNGIMIWLINRSVPMVPIWGIRGAGIDLLGTSILLPFFMCVINSAMIGKQMRVGKVKALPQMHLPMRSPLFNGFRQPVWKRGLFLGLMGLIFAGIPVIWTLSIGNVESLPVVSLALFKAGWSALLAALMAPIVGWWALARGSVEIYQKLYAEQTLR